jgi:hypothetical protein
MRMGEAVTPAEKAWTLVSGIREEEAKWSQSFPPDAAYAPRRLMYFGLGDPSKMSRATLSMTQLIDGPGAWLDLRWNRLHQYQPLRKPRTFTPDYTPEPPLQKPTTWAACLGAMKIASNSAAKQAAPGGRTADPLAQRARKEALAAIAPGVMVHAQNDRFRSGAAFKLSFTDSKSTID